MYVGTWRSNTVPKVCQNHVSRKRKYFLFFFSPHLSFLRFHATFWAHKLQKKNLHGFSYPITQTISGRVQITSKTRVFSKFTNIFFFNSTIKSIILVLNNKVKPLKLTYFTSDAYKKKKKIKSS